MIANRLAQSGLRSIWWASSFSHQEKRHLDLSNAPATCGDGVELAFMHGRAYRANVSVSRLLNHREEAADFLRQAARRPRPDLIFCAYPTIDLAAASVAFGRRHAIPVVIDVRDLWPEVFLDVSPLPRPLTRLALAPLYARARRALAGATAITAITEPFLDAALALAGRERRADDRVVPLAYDRHAHDAAAIGAAERFWREQGLRLDGSETIVCTFLNLSDVPRFDTLVGALEHLPAGAAESIRVVVAGSGVKLDWLKKAASGDPRLIVPGRIGGAEISALMRHAAAGLLPYPNRRDLLISYPNKVGEFFSAGLPVISTLDGTTGALLRERDCGVVVPEDDPAALARAMAELTGDEKARRRMSANAAAVFTEMFDAETVYGDLVDHLIDITGRGASSSFDPSRATAY
ncbi:MAG: glycosyltransferase [Flavobacteriaceae bacterium]